MRHGLADGLPIDACRLPRFLTFVLIALAILVTPLPGAAASGIHLSHQSSKHPPRNYMAHTRTILASSVRLSSTSGSEGRRGIVKQFATLSAGARASGERSILAGSQHVFRPLRC